MTSSNQDIKTNVTTLECRRGVRGSCFILRRVFLLTLAWKKIMSSSCCVVWLDDVTSSLDPTLSFELNARPSEHITRPELLEAWLAPTSVNYNSNV